MPDPENYTIQFMSNATFQAKADCNNVTGTYATTAAMDLQIKPGPSTLVACAPGSLYQPFLQQLYLAAKYAIAQSELTITLADGGTMTFAIQQ